MAFSFCFSNLHHRQEAIPAEDIHRFRGPDALPAFGTGQLAGAGGPSGRRDSSAFGSWPSHAPHGKAVLPVHHNIIPALGDNELDKRLRRLRDTPPNALVIGDMEVPRLRRLPKPLVVVGPAPAGVLYPGLYIIEMDHFMEHRSRHVLDGPVQGPGSDVQLMPCSPVRPLPRLGYGDVSVSPWRALDSNDRLLNGPVKVMRIQSPENLLQIPRRPAGLDSLLHGPFLP